MLLRLAVAIVLSQSAAQPKVKVKVKVETVPSEITLQGGGLTPQLVTDGLRANLLAMRACMDAELADGGAVSGKVVVRFVIQPTGAVSAASVAETTLGKPTVEACVVNKVGRIVFHTPHGGGLVIVTAPFVFSLSK